MADAGSIPAPLASSMWDTQVPQPGGKQWCHSFNQGMPNSGKDEEESPDNTPEELPTKSKGQW